MKWLWGWSLSVLPVLLPKQIPLLSRLQEAQHPSDGPSRLCVTDLWSTSGWSGMNHAVKCVINVTRCIIDFSCDLRLLQAACWEKSSPDCAHANRYLWSHSFWFPLQHYFHTPVCCSRSLNFLLLQVVWLQHCISLPTPLQRWENIQIWNRGTRKLMVMLKLTQEKTWRDPNLCLLTPVAPHRSPDQGPYQFVQGV